MASPWVGDGIAVTPSLPPAFAHERTVDDCPYALRQAREKRLSSVKSVCLH
jgi:hypothetical protein